MKSEKTIKEQVLEKVLQLEEKKEIIGNPNLTIDDVDIKDMNRNDLIRAIDLTEQLTRKECEENVDKTYRSFAERVVRDTNNKKEAIKKLTEHNIELQEELNEVRADEKSKA